jgi:serine/threonine protein kinase
MIHRDIKPENILVNSCLKIRGFGCAKPLRKPYVPGEMRGHRAAILLTGAANAHPLIRNGRGHVGARVRLNIGGATVQGHHVLADHMLMHILDLCETL